MIVRAWIVGQLSGFLHYPLNSSTNGPVGTYQGKDRMVSGVPVLFLFNAVTADIVPGSVSGSGYL